MQGPTFLESPWVAFGFFLSLWILGSAAVGVHAKGRAPLGAAWGVVVFFGGLFGLVAYGVVLARGSVGDDARTCPECGRENDEEYRYCAECAFEFEDSTERYASTGDR